MAGDELIDDLSRALARGTSRGQFLKLLGAGVLGLFGGAASTAEAKKVKCTDDAQCPTGLFCLKGRCAQVKTTLKAAAPAGTTTLDVKSTKGFVPGATVRLDPGGPHQEDVLVAAIGSLDLSAATIFPHARKTTVVRIAPAAPQRCICPASGLPCIPQADCGICCKGTCCAPDQQCCADGCCDGDCCPEGGICCPRPRQCCADGRCCNTGPEYCCPQSGGVCCPAMNCCENRACCAKPSDCCPGSPRLCCSGPNELCCNSQCVDRTKDPHCGQCNNDCRTRGMICKGGICGCKPPGSRPTSPNDVFCCADGTEPDPVTGQCPQACDPPCTDGHQCVNGECRCGDRGYCGFGVPCCAALSLCMCTDGQKLCRVVVDGVEKFKCCGADCLCCAFRQGGNPYCGCTGECIGSDHQGEAVTCPS